VIFFYFKLNSKNKLTLLDMSTTALTRRRSRGAIPAAATAAVTMSKAGGLDRSQFRRLPQAVSCYTLTFLGTPEFSRLASVSREFSRIATGAWIFVQVYMGGILLWVDVFGMFTEKILYCECCVQ
jgi:hypothetical protein